jgi:enamine deaminase RidA (YjgF/YER057c/UK114 family)
MIPLPFCKLAQDGVAYSVVELNGVNHILATALPRSGFTLQEQTRSTLEAVTGLLQRFDAAGSLLHLTVFLADPGRTATCRQVVRGLLSKNVPATSYVPQPPCEEALVAVEVLALGQGREKVRIERVSDQLLLTHQDGRTWIYADQAVPLTSAPGVYEKTICSFQYLRRLLPRGGARLDQVLRTWLYLGGIVDDDGPVQRYKELNRARADVYEGVPFLTERLPVDPEGPVFPASTGIGTGGRSLTLSAVALLSDEEDVVAVPLENPRQTSAFAYAARYSPQSPKFSRGMAVVEGSDTTLFISGTASITNSETRHIGDVAAQTHESLENIAALISEENLTRHGLPGQGTTLEGLAVARAYIKRREDYPGVRQVCEQRLPGVPITYLVADVCRPNLLVELEGIAFSHGSASQEGATPARVRRCAAGRKERPLPAECRRLCPDGCPERDDCPHATLTP